MTGLEPSAPPLSTPDKSLGWHQVIGLYSMD
jgi:hypothetical protein